jgi:hypothetical protein
LNLKHNFKRSLNKMMKFKRDLLRKINQLLQMKNKRLLDQMIAYLKLQQLLSSNEWVTLSPS